MLKQKLGTLIVLALVSLLTGPAFSDQLESSDIPDMLLGSLASAKVEIKPVSLIHALATHADPRIRGEAADALGLLKETSARPALRRALERDRNELVRQSAALALARLGDESGRSALKKLLAGATDPVQKLFLAAQLAELGEPAGFSDVVKAASSPEGSTRALAAQFLVSFIPLAGLSDAQGRSPSAILLSLANDESQEVRLYLVRGLSSAVLKGLDRGLARETVERLAEHDPDAEVRESAESLAAGWRLEDENARPEHHE